MRGVEVLHVVLAGEEAQLRTRIHRQLGDDREAKRRALQDLPSALTALGKVRDSFQLNIHRPPEQVGADLVHLLRGKGWITKDGQWAREVAS